MSTNNLEPTNTTNPTDPSDDIQRRFRYQAAFLKIHFKI